MMKWQSRPAPDVIRPPGRTLRRPLLTVGVVIATAAGMATVAIGSAQAALAPGTPLKTLAQADGGRYFGSDMTGDLLNNSPVTQLQAQQFSMLTPGNEMKWDTTQPSPPPAAFNFAPGNAIVNYATNNSERVRCHNLVWHSQLPGWVSSLPTSQVQGAMENHITTEVNAFKNKCYAWDVVNEPFNDDATATPRADAFFNAMGIGYIADALRTAHAADPNAKLYLNDYNIEGMNAKSNAMFSLAQSLLAQGAPLNGIGFESHFILGQIPSDMQANMQRFANLGLDVAVTELDVRINLPASSANLTQQATDFSNVVKACLGVSRCVGVTQWAIGDADSWIPGFFTNPPQGAATMFDQSYNPKPAFTSVQNTLASASGNIVTVTSPGNQTSTVGTAVSVQVRATDSGSGQTLTYSATGLPAGLSISSSTGLISGTPTTAATSSVSVTARDGTGASGSASFTWTVNPKSGGGTCHVTYTRNSEWAGGFTAQVVIANTGTTAINGWSLTFTFPGDQKLTSNFNGGFSQSGANATLTNANYNGNIAPGASITDGFQGTWTSNDTSPASFSVNGTACN
jgi:endo-1,4-beta-xylanase